MTNDGRGVGMWGNLPPEQDPGLGVALTPPPRPDVPQSPQHDPWPWEASHAERRAPWRPDGAHRASTIGLEERLVGSWFPRLGALAVVAGAGFGVAYAVQRGWIGPLARVLATAAAGGVAIAVSERARRRDWTAPAQALAAAGVALLYLAVWSSSRIYGFVPLPAALALLSAVTLGAAALAVLHDSELLALLALGAGFLNPFTTDALAGPSALAYVAVMAAGAVVLAARRNWELLERAAFLGAWATAFSSGPMARPAQVAWAGAIFALFAVRPFLRNLDPGLARDREALQSVANGFVFLVFLEVALTVGHLAADRGPAAFGIAAVYVLLWLLARASAPDDTELSRIFQGMAVAMATIGVFFQAHGLALGTLWSVEGVVLLWLGSRSPREDLRRYLGLALVGLGFVRTIVVGLELGAAYLPARLVISPQSLAVAAQVAALAATVRLLRRGEPWERTARLTALVTANAVALGWASAEAHAWFVRRGDGHVDRLAFAYSAIWATYAAGAYAVGIAVRSRGVRLAAAGLFAVTLGKIVLSDAWLLGSVLRTIVFVGVGVLLIVCSLAYHRFRGILVGERDAAEAVRAR
ncbi:MAG: DUF2339 domain-containing protein [Actinomycetota bacterium]